MMKHRMRKMNKMGKEEQLLTNCAPFFEEEEEENIIPLFKEYLKHIC